MVGSLPATVEVRGDSTCCSTTTEGPVHPRAGALQHIEKPEYNG